MPDCPTCAKALNTKQGMRQHHTKVHGDPLPNLTCQGCGSRFYHTKADRAFCEDCDHRAGEHNPNWKDAMEEAECRLCEQTFEYYPSNKDGIFCPDCVESAENFLGTPSYELREIPRIQKKCEYCETDMNVLKSDVDRGRGRFCSAACRDSWMRNEWENPHHAPYNWGWWKVRMEAYERDDHRCQICGKTKEEMGQEPDAHHIKPVREFEVPADAHYLDNVICLCRTCHRKAEFGLISHDRLGDAQE